MRGLGIEHRPPEQIVKDRIGKRMTLWQKWTNELKETFNPAWLIVAAIVTLGVLGLTHIPQESVPKVLRFDRFDKLEHIGAYGTMAVFYLLALRGQPPEPSEGRKRQWWVINGWLGLAILISLGLAAIGAVDELTQPYVHRSCDFTDWLGDATGIAIVCIAFHVKRAIVGSRVNNGLPAKERTR
jgi:hypothetical protein